MIKLYDFEYSGHAHRVRLMFALLGVEYERCPVAMLRGEHREPAFRSLNPWGQIPVLVDGDFVLSDSAAMLVYLAERFGPEWLSQDPKERAQIQRWLSVAAGELFRGPVAARAATLFGYAFDIGAATKEARRLFKIMDAHLVGRTWLASEKPTVADVALYSYLAVADEGGLSLAPFGEISAWLGRVEQLPRFLPMPRWSDDRAR